MEEDRLHKENISEEENPNQTMIRNDSEKINISFNTSQMEQQSILSNVINYVQYSRNPIDYYNLDVTTLEAKKHKRIHVEENDRHVIDIFLVIHQNISKEKNSICMEELCQK